jgi:hypothetical protein
VGTASSVAGHNSFSRTRRRRCVSSSLRYDKKIRRLVGHAVKHRKKSEEMIDTIDGERADLKKYCNVE